MSSVNAEVPRRFQELTLYSGYGQPPVAHPRFRTSNQTYGNKAPTVHELPNSYHPLSHTFSNHLGKIGMSRRHGLNTAVETSHCTGSDTFITAYEHMDFHPSYNPNGPSHCRDQP
ncbi:piercer of microtubule wall 1 protein [Malurus melanocephalus]|uniref:piercer of microtubule wall 1 protein n=1 Tax=Malurus melanocephalus TaxID=175006 RepID=UPI0025466F45|nr:piercer of microtubule wall 1 protein [Malurus melanocephalus]